MRILFSILLVLALAPSAMADQVYCEMTTAPDLTLTTTLDTTLDGINSDTPVLDFKDIVAPASADGASTTCAVFVPTMPFPIYWWNQRTDDNCFYYVGDLGSDTGPIGGDAPATDSVAGDPADEDWARSYGTPAKRGGHGLAADCSYTT